MSLDQEVISKATDKKYSEFSDAIKAELKTKMANHPDAKQYASDFDKIQDMKNMFAKISNSEEK